MAATANFFYYNPDSVSENRQQDLFSPQPSAILRSSPMQHHEAAMQQYYMSAIHTPRPMHKPGLFSQEPHVLSLDTDFHGFEEQGYPMTPGLSVSGSTVSSPPQSSYLPTPTNGFFGNLPGVKEGCEREVKSEILSAGIDWSRSGSPLLTPGMQHHLQRPNSQLQRKYSNACSWASHTLVGTFLLTPLRSVRAPALSDREPSLGPPFHHSLLPFPFSLPIASTSVCRLGRELLRPSQPDCEHKACSSHLSL